MYCFLECLNHRGSQFTKWTTKDVVLLIKYKKVNIAFLPLSSFFYPVRSYNEAMIQLKTVKSRKKNSRSEEYSVCIINASTYGGEHRW